MANIKSINMTIASKTLTDKFNMQTYDFVDINQFLTVSIKGFTYTFKISEITEPNFNPNLQNNLSAITGVYDIEDILNTEVAITIPDPDGLVIITTATDGTTTTVNYPSAIQVMSALAATFGKTANIKITNFVPSEIKSRANGKEVISALFGWMDKIPQKLINVFIRDNVINVIQRGEESGVIPLVKFANVTRNRKEIRTLQSPVNSEGSSVGATALTGEPVPDITNDVSYLSGTFVNGDISITYTNGLVTKEIHTVNDVDEVTTYTYSSNIPPAYLTAKNTTTADGRIDVTYTISDEKLVKEVEKHYTGDILDMTRITRHYPIGQGMWGTSIEEDGKTTYGGISQGAPGGKASPYSISQDSKSTSQKPIPPVVTITERPFNKYLGSVPVYGVSSLQYVVDAFIWLDKKIETRVSLESYDSVIYDFTSRILWQGDEYYLESNNVTVDPDKTVQKLEMVRWV